MTSPERESSQALLEHLLESSPVVMHRQTTQDATSTWVSSNVGRILGFSPEEIIGVPGWWRDHLHPEDQPRVYEDFANAAAARAPEWETEARFLRRDGTAQWVAIVTRPVYDPVGHPTGIDVYVWDISTRHQLWEERRLAEDRFRRVVESVPNAILVVDQGGIIELVNPQAEELFGYRRDELVGQPIEILLPSGSRGGHPALRAGYLVSPTTRAMGHNRDLRALHRDGHEIPVEVGLNPIGGEEGSRILASVIDISVRKTAEAALVAARAEAVQASLAKSEFLSRMSHEFRTPLNAILGFGQVLAMDDLTAEQRDSLDHIDRAGHHLLQLINEVLDISRIEAREMTLSPEPVAVVDLLAEAIGLISPLAYGRRITLDSTTLDCDVHVLADRQRLTQVFLNLLSNAVKYNREGGSVVAGCTVVGEGRLRITVTDTGHGISSDQLDRLFRPFERLGAKASMVEGTGLGLALSQGLVEAMGGTIGVESEVDRGTTFWVELAVVEGPLEAYERRRTGGAAMFLAGRRPTQRVLLIEDNLSNRKLIERVLARRPQIELIAAMQGRLGMELAREHKPDLILLDLHLPDMSGREVLSRLRSYPETRGIPIVIISADATPQQIARLTEEGAAGYLTKPLDIAAFFELIDGILGAPGAARP